MMPTEKVSVSDGSGWGDECVFPGQRPCWGIERSAPDNMLMFVIYQFEIGHYLRRFWPNEEWMFIVACELILSSVRWRLAVLPPAKIGKTILLLKVPQTFVNLQFLDPKGTVRLRSRKTDPVQNNASPVPVYDAYDDCFRIFQVSSDVHRRIGISKREVALLLLFGILPIEEEDRECSCDGRGPTAESAHPLAETVLVCAAAPLGIAYEGEISGGNESEGAEKRTPSKYKKPALPSRKHAEFNSIIGANMARAA